MSCSWHTASFHNKCTNECGAATVLLMVFIAPLITLIIAIALVLGAYYSDLSLVRSELSQAVDSQKTLTYASLVEGGDASKALAEDIVGALRDSGFEGTVNVWVCADETAEGNLVVCYCVRTTKKGISPTGVNLAYFLGAKEHVTRIVDSSSIVFEGGGAASCSDAHWRLKSGKGIAELEKVSASRDKWSEEITDLLEREYEQNS